MTELVAALGLKVDEAPVDGSEYIRKDGGWAEHAAGRGGDDHGELDGLSDDDHSQYHNDSRGDARYSLLAHAHTATATAILEGLPTAAQNIHGADGTLSDVTWDTSTNNATYIDTFVNGDSDIVAVSAMEVAIHASVDVVDIGLNNRQTYALKLIHKNSADSVLRTYYCDDTYVRDDADTYDSGLMGLDKRVFMAAGDKLVVQVEVLDAQTSSGTVSPGTTYSQVFVDRITYG